MARNSEEDECVTNASFSLKLNFTSYMDTTFTYIVFPNTNSLLIFWPKSSKRELVEDLFSLLKLK